MSDPIYRIRDWNTYFENNRTRELKKMDWIPVKTKHDGDGFTELLDHPNGTAHYGAWHLILQVASKCRPRGTLVREVVSAESRTLVPHTADSIGRMSHGSAVVISEAIPRLVSIGWLEVCNDSRHSPAPSCDEVTIEESTGEESTEEERRASAPTNHPDLEQAVAYFQKNDAGYSREEIEECFESFGATANNGFWYFGSRQVTDWRDAMSTRLRSIHKRSKKKKGRAYVE